MEKVIMGHMIDESTGRAAIAYAGRTPWHGLGQQLSEGADIDTWTREAGLGYSVQACDVQYETPAVTGLQSWPERKVLTRSDTGAPLAVVSKDYRVVQPAEVMDFFRKLTDIGGFQMETAGALSHGRRVWALARVGDGAPVVDGDLVKPYLLLGTSYDGTMATIAKFTAIRVVCNNTITPAVNSRADETDKGYLKSSVRVLHSAQFDADAVRLQLGIVADQFERFIVQSRQLARIDMNFTQADQFVQELLRPYHQSALEITDTKAYKRVIELWQGRAIGSDILSASKVSGSRWAMLNAVTQLVDHERGRSDNTRLESAWFGTGAALKNRALELLAA
jgi:phage/plasmid-like protein (TIGR03299 family)